MLISFHLFLLKGRPPQPPKRDPRTTLSVGRARARSMVVALNDMGTTTTPRNGMTDRTSIYLSLSILALFSSHTESSQSSTETAEDIYSNSSSRTASIRSRSGSGRVSTTDLERLSAPTVVAPPAPPSEAGVSPRSPRVYASVAEMKRMRVRTTAN